MAAERLFWGIGLPTALFARAACGPPTGRTARRSPPSRPVVSRLQFFELFGADGRLQWKRLLPMEFSLIERDTFERMALSAGFRVADLYGGYNRAPFDPERSPVMIWMLEKGS